MFHSERTWGPPRKVATAEELAELLTERTWCLCSAFEHAGYLYLNDAISEDGAQEYAVLRRTPPGFRQIESITFSWCSTPRALEIIGEIAAGKYDTEGHDVSPQFDLAIDHCCDLCA